MSCRLEGVPGRAGGTAGGEAGGIGPVHGGGPAEAFEEADDGGGDVDLAGAGAVAGAGGIGMMAVVPAFPEGEQGKWRSAAKNGS